MTAAYRIVIASKIVRNTTSGAFIPFDTGNRDYSTYVTWDVSADADAADPAFEVAV